MDTDVVDPSAPANAPLGEPAAEQGEGTPEATIDEVDRLLDEVEAALTRLDEGTYGTCTGCGAPIEDSRLAVLPTAQTCAPCDRDGGADSADDDWGAAIAGGSPADTTG